MILVKCDNCENNVEKISYEVKRYKHHFCSDECKFKWLSNFHMGLKASEETKQKMSLSHKGKIKVFTEDHKRKLSKNHANVSGKNHSHYGKSAYHGKGSWYERLDGSKVWLRSTYETRVAACLDKLGIQWEYEYKRFVLNGIEKTYCPDFYLTKYNIYIEVKGWMWKEAKDKIERFITQYPQEKLIIMYKKDIEHLEVDINGSVGDQK